MNWKTSGAIVGTFIISLVCLVLVFAFINQNQTIGSLQQQLAGLEQGSTPSMSAASGQPTTDNSQQNQNVTVNVNGTCTTECINGDCTTSTCDTCPSPSVGPGSSPVGCSSVEAPAHGARYNQLWAPSEPGWIVLRGWSNTHPANEADRPAVGGTVYVTLYGPDPNQRPKGFVGGSYWIYQSKDCAIHDFLYEQPDSYNGLYFNLSGENLTAPDGSNMTIKSSLDGQNYPKG